MKASLYARLRTTAQPWETLTIQWGRNKLQGQPPQKEASERTWPVHFPLLHSRRMHLCTWQETLDPGHWEGRGGCRRQTAWVRAAVSALTGRVTLGKLLPLLCLSFLTCKIRMRILAPTQRTDQTSYHMFRADTVCLAHFEWDLSVFLSVYEWMQHYWRSIAKC